MAFDCVTNFEFNGTFYHLHWDEIRYILLRIIGSESHDVG